MLRGAAQGSVSETESGVFGKGQSEGIGDNLEEEQFRMALERSTKEMFHDPAETPDTGGSAASASPSLQSTPQAQSQPGDQPSMSKEELSRTQALFKSVCDEVEELQRRMRGADFTTHDMERLEYLQCGPRAEQGNPVEDAKRVGLQKEVLDVLNVQGTHYPKEREGDLKGPRSVQCHALPP